MSLAEVVNTIIRRIFFYGSYYHLWFFPGMIWILILLGIAKRVRLKKLLAGLAILLYIAVVFTYTWYGMGSQYFPSLSILMDWFDFDYIRRFLGVLLPFVFLGEFIQFTKGYWLEKATTKKLYVAVALSVLANMIEIEAALLSGNSNGTSASFTAPIVIYFVFMLALRYPNIFKKKGIFFRKTSVIMYGLHPLLLEIIGKLAGNALEGYNTLLWFSCVIIICLGTSIAMLIRGRMIK